MTDDSQPSNTVVIDNGTSSCRAGYALDEVSLPKVVVPSVVLQQVGGDSLVGREALARLEREGAIDAVIRNPVERGCTVWHWEEMSSLWKHIFEKELKVASEDRGVILTEPPLNPNPNRERMTQIMFEDFRVPSLYIANQAVVSLYAAGRQTGIVLDIGETATNIVPIVEGHEITPSVLRLDVGGADLDAYLARLLRERHGLSLRTDWAHPLERALVKDIKEKHSFVALDYDAESASHSEKTIEVSLASASTSTTTTTAAAASPLASSASATTITTTSSPSTTTLKLGGVERYGVPEALFKPPLVGVESIGVPEAVYSAVMSCEPDVRKDLYSNLVLSGGGSMFAGIAERVQRDMVAMAPSSVKVGVVAIPERRWGAWVGASIFGSLSTFGAISITREEYDESGPSMVHRKCF